MSCPEQYACTASGVIMAEQMKSESCSFGSTATTSLTRRLAGSPQPLSINLSSAGPW
jgi:hypothetical protein